MISSVSTALASNITQSQDAFPPTRCYLHFFNWRLWRPPSRLSFNRWIPPSWVHMETPHRFTLHVSLDAEFTVDIDAHHPYWFHKLYWYSRSISTIHNLHSIANSISKCYRDRMGSCFGKGKSFCCSLDARRKRWHGRKSSSNSSSWINLRII